MRVVRHGEIVNHWRLWKIGLTIYRRVLREGEYGFLGSRGRAVTFVLWRDQ